MQQSREFDHRVRFPVFLYANLPMTACQRNSMQAVNQAGILFSALSAYSEINLMVNLHNTESALFCEYSQNFKKTRKITDKMNRSMIK